MDIPVSPSDLNEVVYNIARDVLEQRAIDGKLVEFSQAESDAVLNEVIFVVERYMYYINSLMDTARLANTPKLEIK